MCQQPTDNPGLDLTLNIFRGLVFNIIAAVLAGLLVNLIAHYFVESNEPNSSVFNLPWLAKLHWAAWICIFPIIYSVVCYVTDRRVGERIVKPFTVPTWTQLQSFGDKRIARVSYWALAIIPFVAYTISSNPFSLEIFKNMEVPLSFKLAFFASWFFSISLFLFTVGRPDMPDSEQANYKQNSDFDSFSDIANLELRAAIYLFYTLGISIAIIIFCRSAWVVVHA